MSERASRRVGIKEVAAAAGVSWKTVSNVVNGTGRVGAATRERVEAVIAELDYRPNLAGRQLRRGRTNTLALAVPWVHAPYFSVLAHELIEVAGTRGYRVLIEETRSSRDIELEVARGFDVQAIDGIIFSPLELTPAQIDEARGSLPLVLLGERADQDPARERRTDHVSIDNVAAAAQVTTHLLEGGRRRLGFLGAEPRGAGRTGAQRVQGFLDAHAAAEVDVDERWVLQVDQFSRPAGASTIEAALPRIDQIDGLVCANDELALGALYALRRNGVRVPEDLAVTGWDNTEDGRYANPSLTTVAPDLRAIAETAVDRVLTQLEKPSVEPVDAVVPHRLLVRESSRT
ncbi:LacI family DNA-binding transcriptional regulator [Promicromonospora thailandica]|uniref:Transcriptional regulator, LacI family n=1 Tax=Promicromonospora thailandica TaxID=765201 RepID=A0A9X2G1U4_9MICO|nr:LacI family DNA-binding transcriptional regulator [Promicromonospora thailandica]MCP2265274.1 transcriptional regulator, LacI family [Promicromonospora thailandica]BFF19636.1 LacI family DNA-binding transcriptional regulator [Promicromonospora thailandica]